MRSQMNRGTSSAFIALKKSELIIGISAILVFFLSKPYFVWFNIPASLFIISLSVLFLLKSKIDIDSAPYLMIFLLLYLTLLMRSKLNIYGVTSIFLMISIFIADTEYLDKVYAAYAKLFAITIIPSLIIYALVTFANYEITATILEPLNPLKKGFYYQYPFLVKWNHFMTRFSGYYDEPGAVGTVSAILLMSRSFNLKDKLNIPIFIAGILSLSLFFYVTLFVYSMLFARTRYKITLLLIGVTLYTLLSSNEVLYQLLFRRLEIHDGILVGLNRTEGNFDQWYESFKHTDDYLWGLGGGANDKYNSGGASYKDLIVNYGVIYFGLFMVAMSGYAWKKIQSLKYFVIYLYILFGVVFQRPFITDMFYLFLIFAPIHSFSKKGNQYISP
jgi:hypothetical protein